jgi:acetyl esterase/lipase
MEHRILEIAPPKPDLRVAYGSGRDHYLDLRFPRNGQGKGPYPLVINIHGGFWRTKYTLDHASHLCAALTAKGVVTANLEYTRGDDQRCAWPYALQDLRCAYRFLAERACQFEAARERVVVMGHSSGGHLALCLAAYEPEITRVITLAGIADLQLAYDLHLSDDAVVRFLQGTPAEASNNYRDADPMQLSLSTAQQWLVHGLCDDVVPTMFSRRYVAAKYRDAPAEMRPRLIEIPRAGHFDIIDPTSAAWQQVEKAVLQVCFNKR